jgi:hypothetical protein
MAAPLREQFKNNAVDELDGSIDASQTTLDVLDGSVFPATGNFRLVIEDEILICTARSTDTLTVIRGQEGTTGASHASGTAVAHILTADGLDRWAKDNFPLWGYSSVPALSKLVADNGTTLLTASSFTWDNQDSATVTDQAGTILMRMDASGAGENVRVQYISAPTAPYSYIAGFQFILPAGDSSDFCQVYMGFRDSGGKLTVLAFQADGLGGGSRVSVYNLNSPTSFNGTPRSRQHCNVVGGVFWMKVEDDSTNLKFYIGDGVEWIQIHSLGRTSFMGSGPNALMWGGNNAGNSHNEALIRLVHWSRLT